MPDIITKRQLIDIMSKYIKNKNSTKTKNYNFETNKIIFDT